MNLDGFALPVKKLKGTDPVDKLDFSGKDLGIASAIIIASLIGVNASCQPHAWRLLALQCCCP